MIRFDVDGIPRPAGSKRAFAFVRKDKATGQPIMRRTKGGKLVAALGTAVTDDSGQAGREWRSDVKNAALAAIVDGPIIDGPLELVVVFRMPRPKGHLRTDGTVKPKAPAWPECRPDVDKLSRAVLDALKGIAWRDDGQVCVKRAMKIYTTGRPGCSVLIEPLVEAWHDSMLLPPSSSAPRR